jgi:hypothetical protein
MDKQLEQAMLKAEQDLARIEPKTDPFKTGFATDRATNQEYFVPDYQEEGRKIKVGLSDESKQKRDVEIHPSQRDIEKYGLCVNYQQKVKSNY